MSLSCISTQEQGFIKDSLCLAALSIPSTLTVPAADIYPRSMMPSPPCSHTGMVLDGDEQRLVFARFCASSSVQRLQCLLRETWGD